MKKLIAIILTVISVLSCFGIIAGAKETHNWDEGYVSQMAWSLRNEAGESEYVPIYCYTCKDCGEIKYTYGTCDDEDCGLYLTKNNIKLDYSIKDDIVTLDVFIDNADGFTVFDTPIIYDGNVIKAIKIDEAIKTDGAKIKKYCKENEIIYMSAYNKNKYYESLGKSTVLSGIIVDEKVDLSNFKLFSVEFKIIDKDSDIDILCGNTGITINAHPNDEIHDIDYSRLCLDATIGIESYEIGSEEFIAYDVNNDNEITVSDARLILRKSLGLE